MKRTTLAAIFGLLIVVPCHADLATYDAAVRAACAQVDGVSGDGTVFFQASASPACRTAVALVVANKATHLGAPTPVTIPLSTLQARIDTEGAWDTYVTYMFAVPARRNALLKIMMMGQPVDITNASLKTTLLGSGLVQAAVDRILAPPP